MRFWYLRRRPEAVRNEVDEELRIHLEMRIEDLRANGLSPDEARREADAAVRGHRRDATVLPAPGSGKGESRAATVVRSGSRARRQDRPPQPAARPGPHADRRRHRRSRHRRHDRDLRGRQRGPAPAVAVQGSGSARPNLHRRPAQPLPVLGCGLPRPRGAADPLRADRRIPGARHGLQQRGDRGAADRPGGDVDLLPAARDHPGHRPRFHGTGGTARPSARGRDQPWPVGTATGQPAGCRGAADSARWRRLHRCRHPPTAARTVRAAAGLLHCRAVVDASPEGPLLHHHAWASPRRRHPIRSRQRTAGDQPPPLSAVAVVVPGRSCDVGSDGSQGVRRRRRSHDGGRRAGGGGAGVADRDGERRQPAGRARHEPPPRAGRADGARRIPGTSRAVPARGERAPGRRRGRRRVVARVGRRPPSANRRRQLLSAHAGNGSQRSGAVAACRASRSPAASCSASSLPSPAAAVQ